MKNHALFSSKDKSKKIKMSSAAIFVWRLRVNRFLQKIFMFHCINVFKYARLHRLISNKTVLSYGYKCQN